MSETSQDGNLCVLHANLKTDTALQSAAGYADRAYQEAASIADLGQRKHITAILNNTLAQMIKITVRALVALLVLSGLTLSTPAAGAKGQTVKVDTRQAVLLVLKMTPGGGKLVVETGIAGEGELTVGYPVESGASLSQAENTLTLQGQARPSTYTVRVPNASLELNIEVNGKTYNIQQGWGSKNRYEFRIK